MAVQEIDVRHTEDGSFTFVAVHEDGREEPAPVTVGALESAVLGAAEGVVDDADLDASELTFERDEEAGQYVVRGKESDGTVVSQSLIGGQESPLAIPDNADSTSDSAVAVGPGSLADGTNSTAVGVGSEATGDSGCAVGDGSWARNWGVSVGMNSEATGQNAVAVGMESYAPGSGAVAVGKRATASGDGSVSLGGVVEANDAVGIGSRVETVGVGRIGVDQFVFGATQGTIANADLNNSEATVEIDEANTQFILRGKDSNGNAIQGTVSYTQV